jgi:hypothetical protein
MYCLQLAKGSEFTGVLCDLLVPFKVYINSLLMYQSILYTPALEFYLLYFCSGTHLQLCQSLKPLRSSSSKHNNTVLVKQQSCVVKPSFVKSECLSYHLVLHYCYRLYCRLYSYSSRSLYLIYVWGRFSIPTTTTAVFDPPQSCLSSFSEKQIRPHSSQWRR